MDELARESERLYNNVKKYCGPNCPPSAKRLEEMSRKLYDDFRGIINPRELERQATAIKESLYHSMEGGEMLTTHCSELKDGYEKLRLSLRKFQ